MLEHPGLRFNHNLSGRLGLRRKPHDSPMYSEVHASIGWLIAQPVRADRRFRISITLAGLLPDLDALTFFLGSNWFSRFHHVWTHNIGFGLLLSLAATRWAKGTSRWKTFVFTQLAFWSHILGDLYFSRMPVALLWPFSGKMFTSSHAYALWHPVNHALVWISLLLVVLAAYHFKRTPMELLSPALDQRLTRFFLTKRTKACHLCGRNCNETCSHCRRPTCTRHARLTKGFQPVCTGCADRT